MVVRDIHLKEHLGIVTSDTSTIRFSFFLTPLKDRISVRKNDYVMVDHPVLGEVCPVLAVVKEISNYEKAAGLSFAEKAVELVAACEVVGYVDLRGSETRVLRALLFPPDTGSKVYLPYYDFLKDVFLRDWEGKVCSSALHLGTCQTFVNTKEGGVRRLGFFLNDWDFTRQHFLVSGVSGVGKTHVAAVVVEELANRTGVPVVVLDSYGEYVTVGFKGDFSGEGYPFDFMFSVYSSDPERVRSRLDGLGAEAEAGGRFSVKPVSSQWVGSGKKSVGSVGGELAKSICGNGVTVFDAEGLSFEEKRVFFANSVLSLLESRVKGLVEPFFLVVDDAEIVGDDVLRRVAVEGKRLGVSVCLLTCNPSELDGAVLSQMGTQILGRTTGSWDLECLSNMALEHVSDLPRLAVGEFIVNGVTLRKPTKVQVRERYSAKTSSQD
ncbi:MAG: ATP-binding protein [Candidatus Bathyarchaeota archaeon]